MHGARPASVPRPMHGARPDAVPRPAPVPRPERGPRPDCVPCPEPRGPGRDLRHTAHARRTDRAAPRAPAKAQVSGCPAARGPPAAPL